jgi:uncharacterized protein HemX
MDRSPTVAAESSQVRQAPSNTIAPRVASEQIILYEGLLVLVLVLGVGVWELFSLKRANREAREKEAAAREQGSSEED